MNKIRSPARAIIQCHGVPTGREHNIPQQLAAGETFPEVRPHFRVTELKVLESQMSGKLRAMIPPTEGDLQMSDVWGDYRHVVSHPTSAILQQRSGGQEYPGQRWCGEEADSLICYIASIRFDGVQLTKWFSMEGFLGELDFI